MSTKTVPTTPSPTQGEMYLVSAGIGDADNLTLKALKTIQSADLILAMPFVEKQLAEHFPEGVEILDAGHGLFTSLARSGVDSSEIEKRETHVRHRVRQAVSEGLCVVVVEFGDPTLFGPQVGYLGEFHDLNPVIIPGISSFNAANALLAQPLLHSSSQRLMMTTAGGIKDYTGIPPDVLVLFTMRLNVEELCSNLLKLYTSDTPLVLVLSAGFNKHERVIHLTLESFREQGEELEIPWACLIYVGAVDVDR